MFELRIGGYAEARALIAGGWPTRVVRLLPPMEIDEPDKPISDRHLHINVSDTNLSSRHPGAIVPAMEHLLTVLAFTADLTDEDRLLVHCFAGIGRSTAAAIGICIQHGMSYKEAFDYVREIRDILHPNRDFIRLIDEHFGLDGQLIAYAAQHKPTYS